MSLFKPVRVLALMLATLPVLAACEDSSGPANKSAAGGRPPTAVSTITTSAEDIPVVSDLPGRVAPTNSAEVHPRVSGLIVERVFEQGSIVKAGDVLYRIDPEPFRVQVESAEATLARAKAVQTQARLTADRQRELRSRNVASAQTLDDAVAALAQADADVAAARAGLAAAKLDLQYSEVKAPISGRIGRAYITEGALVASTSTESLAAIRQLDPVYADFTQSAKQLRELREAIKKGEVSVAADGNATVHLFFDDGDAYPIPGRLLLTESLVDSTTGQVTLRGEFPNPDQILLPGMYVRVRIEQGIRHNTIAIPQQAVQHDTAGNSRVYVVRPEDKTLDYRIIKTGAATGGDRWIVESGLEVGETIVVEGFQKIRPGAPVTPQPWNPQKTAQAATGKQ